MMAKNLVQLPYRLLWMVTIVLYNAQTTIANLGRTGESLLGKKKVADWNGSI